MSDKNCSKCGKEFYPRHFHDEEKTKPFDTGYGTDPETNERICFECCALEDLRIMREKGQYDGLYLTEDSNKQWFVTNWPGTLKIGPVTVSTGYHNIARSRRDCWFCFDGYLWHGVSLGDWNDIVRCKKTKKVSTYKKSDILIPEEGKNV